MRTQVPSAAVVYTPDCSVGEARVRTAVGRKSCRCTDTMTVLIRLGSSENRHQTVTDFRFWDSSGLRLCFRPSSQTKVRATLQGSSRLSQVMSSLCQLVCLISLSREDLPGVPFWSLFVRLWSFMNDLWICVLYVFSLKTQRETQIKDVSCILAILLGPAFLWCPQHWRFRCPWTSCVSLLAPYESWEVLLLSLQTSSLQAWCSRPAGGQVWGHDLNLYQAASQFIANIVRSLKLRVMFGSTSAGESRAIDLSCDQHDVTQWQNSKLAQQVACFVQCQSYQIWFVVGLWQFVNVCLMKNL